jgi:hypothetical protein
VRWSGLGRGPLPEGATSQPRKRVAYAQGMLRPPTGCSRVEEWPPRLEAKLSGRSGDDD